MRGFKKFNIYNNIIYNIPRFLYNIWLFRKNLWNHVWDNGSDSFLPWIKTIVDDIVIKMHKYSYDDEYIKSLQINKMKRLSYLIDIYDDDFFLISEAEKELGVKLIINYKFEMIDSSKKLYRHMNNCTPEEISNNLLIVDKVEELKKMYWDELCEIIKGKESNTQDFINYDGSGIKNWYN
jgi:hypothetical protein